MEKVDNYYSNSRKEVMEYIDFKPKKVLELGCGQGVFGRNLKEKYDCEVTGIEINKRQAKKAISNIDKVLCMDIEEAINSIKGDKFDLIVANDVLEHLVDPYSIIRKLKNNLSKNGKFVSSIPNVRNYYVIYALLRHKDWKYSDSGVLDRTHLRFFTYHNIFTMFEDNGYKVLRQEGINKEMKLPLWFNMLNYFSFKKLEDMTFLQFVTVAEVR